MKTIFRTEFKEHFVCLPNAMLRDSRLSLRARGLLAMILTHSEEWVITKEWLLGQIPEGKFALAATFRELESNGYAVMVEVRDKGRIVSNVWTFHAHPVEESDRTTFCQKKDGPPTGEPPTQKTVSGGPATKNTMQKEEPCSEEPHGAGGTAKPKRPRDELFDTIATITGIDLTELNQVTASMIAKSKQQILQSSPQVTTDEIKRRAYAYRKKFTGAELTPTALAKYWPTLGATQHQDTKQQILSYMP